MVSGSSDAGGGHENCALADISLFRMVGEIKSFIEVDIPFLRSIRQEKLEPWGTTLPHDTLKESAYSHQATLRHENPVHSGHITVDYELHKSVEAHLSSTQCFLLKIFGSRPMNYVPLNEFEDYCKSHWNEDVTEPSILDNIDVILQ
ncbi:hypothetical protein BDR07DRAFT_1446625 [Suillus spraguei]|nr:hypothetical protein BDR07DRAFT_1446625 [Suillus spraguei]